MRWVAAAKVSAGRSQARWSFCVPTSSKMTGGTFHSTSSRTKLKPLTWSIPKPGASRAMARHQRSCCRSRRSRNSRRCCCDRRWRRLPRCEARTERNADWQRQAEIKVADLRDGLTVHDISGKDARPYPSRHRQHRSIVHVRRMDLTSPVKPGEIRGNILGARQRVDLVVIGKIVGNAHRPRIIENQPVGAAPWPGRSPCGCVW